MPKKAPSFFLTAVGAARIVGGPPGPATPLLLIFHEYSGAETVFNMNAALRAEYPTIEQLQIASVVCLQQIPRYMRSTVEQMLLAAYHQAASAIPATHDPTEYVLIVPDWDAKASIAFGMDDCGDHIGVALVVDGWQLFETYRGPEPLSAAFRMLYAAFNLRNDIAVEPGTQR